MDDLKGTCAILLWVSRFRGETTSTRLHRQSQPPSNNSTPPLPRDPSPTVIEAVAIGRGLVDEATVHIIGNVFGDGCTLTHGTPLRSRVY